MPLSHAKTQEAGLSQGLRSFNFDKYKQSMPQGRTMSHLPPKAPNILTRFKKWVKQKVGKQLEEDEELETIVYSSGESDYGDSDMPAGTTFNMLSRKEQEERV